MTNQYGVKFVNNLQKCLIILVKPHQIFIGLVSSNSSSSGSSLFMHTNKSLHSISNMTPVLPDALTRLVPNFFKNGTKFFFTP